MRGKDGRARGAVVDLPEEVFTTPPRDPIVDLFLADGEIHVTCELLGVDEESIHVCVKERTLVIHATGGMDIHTREIWLPVPVETDEIKKHYKNGVLEVILKQRSS